MGGTMTGRSVSAMPGLDLSEQRAWENFLDAALRVYGSLNRTLSEQHKLSLVDVRLLEILSSSETGAARMGDLAEQLLSLPSRVTRQIRRLEEAGLVRRGGPPPPGRGGGCWPPSPMRAARR
jgi:DNA-binding transcriptional ArsR family regulator